MSTGTIISLVIVILSIILLITVGVISYKQMKPTIKGLQKLNTTIEHKSKLYTREGENLQTQFNQLQLDATLVQSEIQEKSLHFQDFMYKQDDLQSSIQYLQGHASGYSKGIATNIKEEIKDEGPKIFQSFKLAFKKTAKKQKARRKNKRKS